MSEPVVPTAHSSPTPPTISPPVASDPWGSWPRFLLGRAPKTMAAFLTILLVIGTGPVLLRPVIERQIAGALGLPVALGSFGWRPLRGSAELRELRIGEGPSALHIGLLVLDLRLTGLRPDRLTLDELRLEHVTGVIDHTVVAQFVPEKADEPSAAQVVAKVETAVAEREAPFLIAADLVALRDVALRIGGDLAPTITTGFDTRIDRLEITDAYTSLDGSWIQATALLDGQVAGSSIYLTGTGRRDPSTEDVAADAWLGGLAVDPSWLVPPAPLRELRGHLGADVHLKRHRTGDAPPVQTADASLDLRDVQLRTTAGVAAGFATLSIREAHADLTALEARLGELALAALDLTVGDDESNATRVSAQRIVLRDTLGERPEGSPGSIAVGQLDVETPRVVIRGARDTIVTTDLVRLAGTHLDLDAGAVHVDQLDVTGPRVFVPGSQDVEVSGGPLQVRGIDVDPARKTAHVDGVEATAPVAKVLLATAAPTLPAVEPSSQPIPEPGPASPSPALAGPAPSPVSNPLPTPGATSVVAPPSPGGPDSDAAGASSGGATTATDPAAPIDPAAATDRDDDATAHTDHAPSQPAKQWLVTTGTLRLRDGSVTLRDARVTPERPLEIAIPLAEWEGFEAGVVKPFHVQISPRAGGAVDLIGGLAVGPLTGAIAITAEDLPLPAFVDFLGPEVFGPLRLTDGTGRASLAVGLVGDTTMIKGDVTLARVKTAPPDATHPEELLAFHELATTIEANVGTTTTIDVSSVRLAYPYVMVHRRTDGMFPATLVTGSSAASSPAPASAPAAAPTAPITPASDPSAAAGAGLANPPPPASPPPTIRVKRAEIVDGRLDFLDGLVQPQTWAGLSQVNATAQDLVTPPGTVRRFALDARLNHVAPLRATGSLDQTALRAKAEIDGLVLSPFNPYSQPAIQYVIESGSLTFKHDIVWSRGKFDTQNSIVLRDLSLANQGDGGVLNDLGIPITIALALLKDTQGVISFDVPVKGDPKNPQFDLGAVVLQAVKKVLVGLLTAPLKLLGGAFGGGGGGSGGVDASTGASSAMAIDPMTFEPGSANLDGEDRARTEQLGRVLRAGSGLRVALRAHVSAADVRALRLSELRSQLGVDESGKQDERKKKEVADEVEDLAPLLSATPVENRAALEAQLDKTLPFPTERVQALARDRLSGVQSVLDLPADATDRVQNETKLPNDDASVDPVGAVTAEIRP